MVSKLLTHLKKHWRWLLVLSFLLLLPTKNAFNIPFGIMTILGFVCVVRHYKKLVLDPGFRLLILLFGCIWIPMVIALFDAQYFEVSAITTLKFLRFLFAGVFVLTALADTKHRQLLFFFIGAIVLGWSLDGLLQFFSGTNILGYAANPKRLTGIFYPHYRIGIVVAVFPPLLIELTRRLSNRWKLLWILLPAPFITVLLSGSRAAWLMLIVVSIAYIVLVLTTIGRRVFTRSVLTKALLVVVVSLWTTAQFPFVVKRAVDATGVFSGDFEAVDVATRRRLSIWAPALEISAAHPVNGIGPRAFRHAFIDHADAENFWQKRDPPGVTHPHMMLLEVLTESGVIGLLGYLVVLVIVFVVSWRNRQTPYTASLGLCVLISLFPLNVHMALYGSYWSSLAFWLLFIWLATMIKTDDRAQQARTKVTTHA